jgi:hypothetical protein
MAASVTWGSESFTGVQNAANSDNFDVGYISFSGILSNEITGITGTGIYHNHGDLSDVFAMDVLLDGVWTNVWSDQPTSSGSIYLSSIATPITFATGLVTGIRLGVINGSVNQGFHYMGQTTFTFAEVSPVPLPASLPLLFGALALGLFLRRRSSS